MQSVISVSAAPLLILFYQPVSVDKAKTDPSA